MQKVNGRFQQSRNFKVSAKDSNFLLMVTRYFDDIQDELLKLLITDKKMSEDKAEAFLKNMMSLGRKREKDIKEEVKDFYSKGLSKKQCAKEILSKYYNITKVNKYEAPMENQEEISEVNEAQSFFHWKKVSESLFWNFMSKLSSLDLKFIFDTTRINKLDNSLNNKNYDFYMETPTIEDKLVEDEFMYSKLLSNILKVITKNRNSGTGIKFFMGIDKGTILRFGYYLNDKVYVIGGFKYSSNTIKKLSPYVKVLNDDTNFSILSNKFKSSIRYMKYYRGVMKVYLEHYDNISVYTTIIDDKLTLVVESVNNEDVLNKKYIERILISNVGHSLKKTEFDVKGIYTNGKTYYYINLI